MLTSRFCIPESFIPSSTAQWGPSHRNSSKQFLLITHSLLKHIVFLLLGSGSRAGSVYPAQPFPDCHPQPKKASIPQDGWELGRNDDTQKHPGRHPRAGSHLKEGWEGSDILKLRRHPPSLGISSAHCFLHLEFSSLQGSTAEPTHIPLRSPVHPCLQEPIRNLIHPKKAVWSWSQI